MKVNEDKHIEEFIDKIMSETTLENPSLNFTTLVMSEVEAINLKTTSVYKPLISKATWFIILGSIVVFTTYFLTFTNPQDNNWFNKVDYSVLKNNVAFNWFSQFRFSNITTYATLLSAVMLLFQITFLRKYFDKRLDF